MQVLGVSVFQHGKVDQEIKYMSCACAYPEAPAIWHRNYAEILEAAGRLALLRDPSNA